MPKFLITVLLLITIDFNSEAQVMGFGHHWEDGCYYDASGVKTCGLISEYIRAQSLFDGDRHFLFKKDKDDKRVKIYAKDTKAFVVGKDSFVVSNSDILNETPYLQVVIDKPLKLFVARLPRQTGFGVGIPGSGLVTMAVGLSFSYTKNKYYYGTDQDKIEPVNRKEFIETMSKLMADNPSVVAKIKDKTYRYGDLDDLVEFYLRGDDKLTHPAYNPNEHHDEN
jgi:hypothetical protein